MPLLLLPPSPSLHPDRRRPRGPAGRAQPRSLNSVLTDSHRISASTIDYTISEKTTVHDGTRHRRRVGDPGNGRAKNLSASRTVLNYPGHLLGPARMGMGPRRSVVNEWGPCHDLKNLFIVDGSIWATSGGVSPNLPLRRWRSTSPTASRAGRRPCSTELGHAWVFEPVRQPRVEAPAATDGAAAPIRRRCARAAISASEKPRARSTASPCSLKRGGALLVPPGVRDSLIGVPRPR